jgi:hypothetical protein
MGLGHSPIKNGSYEFSPNEMSEFLMLKCFFLKKMKHCGNNVISFYKLNCLSFFQIEF